MRAHRAKTFRRPIAGAFALAAVMCAPMSAPAVAAERSSFAVVTVPARATTPADAPVVVWISGDGGWGKMEREVSDRLAARGVATIGIDSLRYFARKRQPEDAAAFVADLVRSDAKAHGAREVVIVGFSFGADIGPLVVQALPADVRARVRLAAFLSPAARANLRVSPASWLGIGLGPAVEPALRTLAPTPVLCVGNAGIFDDVCGPDTDTPQFRVVRLGGGHILAGRYDVLTDLILSVPPTSSLR